MNFIDHSAKSIAKSIRSHHSEAGSEVALTYALSLLINTLTAIVAALIVCSIAGHFVPCVIGMFSFILLRFVSGGMHMSSSLSCCVLTASIFIFTGFMTFDYSVTFMVLDAISMIILLITAPNDIQNVSSIDTKYYPLLKLAALLIVASNFYVQSTVLTAAFISQAFLTTPIAYTIRDTIEGR
ncbi:accessory gene regulator B family protein [Paenibacillus xerothermodurans]|uniref:Accessory regulator AgrB n=1 Tax=Paenibacillus xerothermodurans TaxID=1977292 RepID=A0A2W1N9C2_PAEXE|nr:accessory gene regulator B family protein [Paenibacillus xerothermodurans]PZE21007.1 hypothetical protein CBW46_010000 [Paenibacillus xerothermodurans]